ncbi:hypothetical protein CHH28_03785 [Bacterioplanes sanyensis]|uniref:Heme biosynthesis operon protein HemX n=1 Tax=Bacterioplanes sanyensis TaxID=1249553 RepID=A0A222FFK1_9GAMM|nr:uroporphyrinogen-III C-methyltransferase [Bacterioplanes sanyensis]ASP37847.1 hypothetical protein CHH28_03785 [Bacterioplanes sanyensis]
MSERTPSSDQEPSKQQDEAKPQANSTDPAAPSSDSADSAATGSDSAALETPLASADAAVTGAAASSTDSAGGAKENNAKENDATDNDAKANSAKENGAKESPQGKNKPLQTNAAAIKRGPHPLSWINLVLMLGLFAVAGYAAWLGWQQQQQTAAELAVVKDRLQQTQQQSGEIRQQEQQLQQQTGQLLADIAAVRQQIEHNSDRLAKLPGAERQDWLLAEAEYLLRLANQRLQLERDWSGALSMLQAADNVLVETRNPAMNPVRASIASEIQALRAVPALDSVGAVYRLQSLQQSLQDLPWLPEKLKRPDIQLQIGTTTESQPWYWQLWDSVYDAFTSMVRIRQRDVAMEAPLTPDQFYYLQQNMHLMLEQAQVALLRQETSLYQHSLQRVEKWLDQYLMAEDERSAAVRTTLTELQQWQVAPAAPDISASLQQLRQLVEQQRRGTVVPAQPAAQEPAL